MKNDLRIIFQQHFNNEEDGQCNGEKKVIRKYDNMSCGLSGGIYNLYMLKHFGKMKKILGNFDKEDDVGSEGEKMYRVLSTNRSLKVDKNKNSLEGLKKETLM